MNRQDFIFTELVTVIIIAAVLCCLTLGAINQSKARAILCADRGRILQKAWHSYTEDFNSGPYSLCGYQGDWRKYHWRDGLWPYLDIPRDEKSWLDNLWCPETDRFKSSWISINTEIAPNNRKATPVKPEDLKRPELTVVMADSKWDTYTNLWGGSFTSRHNNGHTCNFTMADGSSRRARTLSPIAFEGEERSSYPPSQFYYTAKAQKKGWPNFNYNQYE